MNKSKILIIISSMIIAFILIGLLIWQFIVSNNFKLENKELQEKNEILNETVDTLSSYVDNLNGKTEILNNQIDILNNKIKELGGQVDNEKTCTFIKTFHYIETIDYLGQANERFVVFNQFQTFSPILFRISDDINIKFEKGLAYEIKFTGLVTDKNNMLKYTILSITKTDKVGFDQVQDNCAS